MLSPVSGAMEDREVHDPGLALKTLTVQFGRQTHMYRSYQP